MFISNNKEYIVSLDVTPCGSCNNRRFRGTYRLHLQSENNQRTINNVSSDNNYFTLRRILRSVLRLLVTVNVVLSSLIILLIFSTQI
jgi:hypothetical protein